MRALPHLAVPFLAAAAVVASGCGGDAETRAARAQAPVALEVSAPADSAVVRGDSVDVSGSVEPAGAAVRVLGRPASVSGGTFTANVPLEPGANVIDVTATARGRAPALTAFRVTRELPVAVPELDGATVEEAQQRVEEAGLELEVEHGGGLFEELLAGEPAVCEQEPGAGEEVRRGTTVEVVVAKRC
jgi:Glucodextranase, domain B/PASTA domain